MNSSYKDFRKGKRLDKLKKEIKNYEKYMKEVIKQGDPLQIKVIKSMYSSSKKNYRVLKAS